MKREPELYLISLIHILGHLKEEVQTYYPNWNFNQGARGFVTYRLDREYGLQEIYEKTITFSLVKGILIEKGEKSYINPSYLKLKRNIIPTLFIVGILLKKQVRWGIEKLEDLLSISFALIVNPTR